MGQTPQDTGFSPKVNISSTSDESSAYLDGPSWRVLGTRYAMTVERKRGEARSDQPDENSKPLEDDHGSCEQASS